MKDLYLITYVHSFQKVSHVWISNFTCSSPVAFITTFVTLFALVIAITKDLPHVEGDRKEVARLLMQCLLQIGLLLF